MAVCAGAGWHWNLQSRLYETIRNDYDNAEAPGIPEALAEHCARGLEACIGAADRLADSRGSLPSTTHDVRARSSRAGPRLVGWLLQPGSPCRVLDRCCSIVLSPLCNETILVPQACIVNFYPIGDGRLDGHSGRLGPHQVQEKQPTSNLLLRSFLFVLLSRSVMQDKDEAPAAIRRGDPIISLSIGDAADFAYRYVVAVTQPWKLLGHQLM